MKSFNLLRVQLRRMGLLEWESRPNGKILSIVTNCIIFGIAIVFFVSTTWFFLFVARTTIEHTESFVFVGSSAMIIEMYSMCFWHKQKHGALFDEIDGIIERSECIFE